MFAVVVTAAVSQAPIFWLKALAPSNMPAMLVTAVVFHVLPLVARFWSNAGASLNICCMVVTAAVFQLAMALLKVAAP